MSLIKIKNRARSLEKILPDQLEKMRSKLSEMSERQKFSKRGKDLKTDIYLCKNLLSSVIDFNGSIEHLTKDEEE